MRLVSSTKGVGEGTNVKEGVKVTIEVGVGTSGVGEETISREGAGAVFLDLPKL